MPTGREEDAGFFKLLEGGLDSIGVCSLPPICTGSRMARALSRLTIGFKVNLICFLGEEISTLATKVSCD
jgi:hypothetical protein